MLKKIFQVREIVGICNPDDKGNLVAEFMNLKKATAYVAKFREKNLYIHIIYRNM